MTDPKLKAQCSAALDRCLAHFVTKAELARKAGMSVNAISYWFTRGQVGRIGAVKLAKIKALGMTKEQMRPDIKDWTPVKKRKKVTRQTK